jgi:hypothetical protein
MQNRGVFGSCLAEQGRVWSLFGRTGACLVPVWQSGIGSSHHQCTTGMPLSWWRRVLHEGPRPFWLRLSSAPGATETNRIEVGLFGMQNRTFGPYLRARHRRLVSSSMGARGGCPSHRAMPSFLLKEFLVLQEESACHPAAPGAQVLRRAGAAAAAGDAQPGELLPRVAAGHPEHDEPAEPPPPGPLVLLRNPRQRAAGGHRRTEEPCGWREPCPSG